MPWTDLGKELSCLDYRKTYHISEISRGRWPLNWQLGLPNILVLTFSVITDNLFHLFVVLLLLLFLVSFKLQALEWCLS